MHWVVAKASLAIRAVGGFFVLFLCSETVFAQSLRVELVEDRIILMLPESYIEADMLFVRQRRDQRLIRWGRRDEHIDLFNQPIVTIDGPTIDAAARFRGSNSVERDIIASFPIIEDVDSGVKIDISKLFYENIDGIPKALGGLPSSFIPKGGLIEKVQSHERGVDIIGIYTFSPSALSDSERRLNDYFDRAPVSIEVAWSLVVLPDTPMKPREYDPRMGFQKLWEFHQQTDWLDFTGDPVHRWRLEKRNPGAAISDPVAPIVFYLAPNMPERWKPWVSRGILAWLPTFEAAGFSNAIEVRDLSDDIDSVSLWDSRHSIVFWQDWSEFRYTENRRDRGRSRGSVRTIVDPRSGEILKADILLGGPNEILRDKYFIRLAPLDPRAQRIPLPDEVMGEVYKSVTAHEAGHAFGLRDGNYGEYAYPAELARSREWLEEMGHTPSVMSYARHNYLAQPEDKIAPELLVQRVGPADHYAIRWGYSVFDPVEEAEKLEGIVREQEATPWYRFSDNSATAIGPDRTNNVVDNDDPIKSSQLGLLNLRRVMALLPEATLHEDGGNALLEHMYFQVLNHWVNLMQHVVSMVGGATTYQKSGMQSGPIYIPLPAGRQREAVAFLAKEALRPPLFLADPSVTRRFEASGTVENITRLQGRVLSSLLSPARLAQMEQQEIDAADGEDVFTVAEMLASVRTSIWTELKARPVKIDRYRKELQWMHIQTLKSRAEREGGRDNKVSAYVRGLLTTELEMIGSDIERFMRKSRDDATLGHLKRLLAELE